jgi:hypothetical protein
MFHIHLLMDECWINEMYVSMCTPLKYMCSPLRQRVWLNFLHAQNQIQWNLPPNRLYQVPWTKTESICSFSFRRCSMRYSGKCTQARPKVLLYCLKQVILKKTAVFRWNSAIFVTFITSAAHNWEWNYWFLLHSFWSAGPVHLPMTCRHL